MSRQAMFLAAAIAATAHIGNDVVLLSGNREPEFSYGEPSTIMDWTKHTGFLGRLTAAEKRMHPALLSAHKRRKIRR